MNVSIKSRVEKLEKKIAPGNAPDIIVIIPDEEKPGSWIVREDYYKPVYHTNKFTIDDTADYKPPVGFKGVLFIDNVRE